MNEQIFTATDDPKEIAARLGLEIVQFFEGILYARDKSGLLYSIGPVDPQGKNGAPADLRLRVDKAWSYEGYVGEEYHTPREGAVHAGLTVIEELLSGDVVALDGFGRKFTVNKTGNGPNASEAGWATEEELEKWPPKHLPWQPTDT